MLALSERFAMARPDIISLTIFVSLINVAVVFPEIAKGVKILFTEKFVGRSSIDSPFVLITKLNVAIFDEALSIGTSK